MKAWQEGVDFGDLVKQNPALQQAGLGDADVDAAMDPRRHSAGRDVIFQRLAALEF